MPKVIKPSNPFTNVCWVSVSINICRQILANIRRSNSRNEEMMGDGVLVLLPPACFEQ